MSRPPRSQRPYLVRAMHEWMSDSGHTPQLVVDAAMQGVHVPQSYVDAGRIVLNVSWSATQGLILGDEQIEFEARFDGQPHRVSLPVDAVLAIYARETREGMLFAEGDDLEQGAVPVILEPDPESITPESSRDDDGDPDEPDPNRPRLRVVK